jgi:hypothetical protein
MSWNRVCPEKDSISQITWRPLQSHGIPKPDPARCNGGVDILAQPLGSSHRHRKTVASWNLRQSLDQLELQFVQTKIARDFSSAFPMHVSACQEVAAIVGHITKICAKILHIEWSKAIHP